ncbi:hypothetical protein [Phaffia rhodozyma]|uniref:F-box domain-containing protein n=1 Tax=Phaffia rhodozyma TaxID=264483 RepID=A0A0F7SXC3_PHARH|nr:hypothetical protein [Phaffia rhodozyma]
MNTRRASFDTIPVDVLETIAFFTATSDPVGPPSDIPSLCRTCKSFARHLSLRSLPHLYARIFRSHFDTAALNRRFPSSNRTALVLSNELVRRWKTLKRVRAGKFGDWAKLEDCLPGEDEGYHDLWTIWIMCMENDGRNLEQLTKYANISTYLLLFRQRYLVPTTPSSAMFSSRLIASSKRRNLPTDSPTVALALWIHHYIFDASIGKDSQDETKPDVLYMLRLFAFAAQLFDGYLSPWTHLKLPITPDALPDEPSPISPYLANLTPRSLTTTIQYPGNLNLEISPPVAAHAGLLSFFGRVQEEGGGADSVQVPGDQGPVLGDSHDEELFRSVEDGLSENTKKIDSKSFDRDWERLIHCREPIVPRRQPELLTATRTGPEIESEASPSSSTRSSPKPTLTSSSSGLGAWRCRHTIQGVWSGSFVFLDFDAYRDMLDGSSRAIYEGPFGLQPQVFRLSEILVKRSPQSQKIVDQGLRPPIVRPAINAGFPLTWSWAGNVATSGALDRLDFGGRGSGSGGRGGIDAAMLMGEQGWEHVDQQEEEEMRERGADVDGLELILIGTGHSAWGTFNISGRVRLWDGLIYLMKDYTPDSRGKWLYRGYVVAGGAMVGRWRDTFTPEAYSGYEGCFQMTKRG